MARCAPTEVVRRDVSVLLKRLRRAAVLLGLCAAPIGFAAPAVQSDHLALSQRSLLLEDSRLPREAMLDRMQQIRFAFREPQPEAEQWQGWSRVQGGDGSWDGDAASARLERRSAELLLGADRRLSGMWMAGALAGVSRSELETDSAAAHSDGDAYHLGLYAATRYYQLGFKFGGSYSAHDLHSERRSGGERLRAQSHAGTAQLFSEASYSLDFREFSIEPFAGLAYVHLDAERLREQGGTQALRVPGASADAAYLTLGWRAATSWQVLQRRLVGRGSLAWRHAYGDDSEQAEAHNRVSGAAQSLLGRTFERDVLRLDLSLDLSLDHELSRDLYLGLTYAGQYAEDARDNSLSARLSLKF